MRQQIETGVGTILKQLITVEGLKSMMEEYWSSRLLDLLMLILKNAIASLRQVFICIDAVDEFPPDDLTLLLELLRAIVRGSPRTKIFLSGRPHVRGAVRREFVGAVVILICPNPKDISNYVAMRLERDDKPGAIDNDLRADIGDMIVEKMSDRWVAHSVVPFY